MRRASLSLVALMLFAALSTSATADQFPADETKMSIELIEDLSKTGNLEVIVQFEQPSSERHWGAVESTGAELLDELSVLHGGQFQPHRHQSRNYPDSTLLSILNSTCHLSISSCQETKKT